MMLVDFETKNYWSLFAVENFTHVFDIDIFVDFG